MDESEVRSAAAAIEHLLRFSSIPRKWPEQNEAYLALASKLREFRMPEQKRMSVDELIERHRLAAVKWAELDAVAARLEHRRKIVRAQIFCMLEGSAAAREQEAEAHPTYTEHVDEMVKARTAANIARAEMDALRLRFEAYRTRSANKRVEQSL